MQKYDAFYVIIAQNLKVDLKVKSVALFPVMNIKFSYKCYLKMSKYLSR